MTVYLQVLSIVIEGLFAMILGIYNRLYDNFSTMLRAAFYLALSAGLLQPQASLRP